MSAWKDKFQWERPANATNRMNGRSQSGFQGDRITPTKYAAYFGTGFPKSVPVLPNGAVAPRFDVPNSAFVLQAVTQDVPFPAARNKAWDKLVNDVRTGPASLGVAFAEMGEACNMIAKRVTQLHQGYRALRHGDFRKFLRTFGIKPRRKHRNLVKSYSHQASSLWLEYSFGWSPMIHDIYGGLTALGQPVPGGPCEGKGYEAFEFNSRPRNGMGERFFTRGRCRMRADVFVTNPNQYLLQQLGIANPASVVWEIIPFSFLVDWVFDVGTFLDAFTAFMGCTVIRPATTYSAKSNVFATWYWDFPPATTRVVTGTIASIKRKPSLDFPFPNFSFHANIGGSLKRAANAVSLLGQLLAK